MQALWQKPGARLHLLLGLRVGMSPPDARLTSLSLGTSVSLGFLLWLSVQFPYQDPMPRAAGAESLILPPKNKTKTGCF